jgi:hypothetical protein
MRIIESASEDSLHDLDEWRDITAELDIPVRIPFSVLPQVIGNCFSGEWRYNN